jgi:hypothetical protein
MTPRLLKLAYLLRHHLVGGWSLTRWTVTLAWGASALVLARWLLRGRPPLAAGHWLALALLVLGGAGLLLFERWGARRYYSVFTPESHVTAPAGNRLAPEDKVKLWATGRFEVEGKTAFFAGLLAYWRTFASREHAVMAIVHPARFLLLARRPDDQVGMWYIFFRPETISDITPGEVAFGGTRGPTLRIIYRYVPAAWQGKKPPKPVDEAVYLAFEDEEARLRVWADLLADRQTEKTRLKVED